MVIPVYVPFILKHFKRFVIMLACTIYHMSKCSQTRIYLNMLARTHSLHTSNMISTLYADIVLDIVSQSKMDIVVAEFVVARIALHLVRLERSCNRWLLIYANIALDIVPLLWYGLINRYVRVVPWLPGISIEGVFCEGQFESFHLMSIALPCGITWASSLHTRAFLHSRRISTW
jgi:hypothetical protein